MASNLVLLDFEAVLRAIYEGNCFASLKKFAKAAQVAENTLKKIKSGQAVREESAIKIESAINHARRRHSELTGAPLRRADWKEWRLDANSQMVSLAEERSARGIWQLTATDIEVKNLFRYEQGPKALPMRITVFQEGRRIWAKGIDRDGDPVKAWNAEFCDKWTYISGRHEIRNDRVYLHGVFFLKYLNTGDRMKGYYLQCETDHESGIVFGSLDLVLVGTEQE